MVSSFICNFLFLEIKVDKWEDACKIGSIEKSSIGVLIVTVNKFQHVSIDSCWLSGRLVMLFAILISIANFERESRVWGSVETLNVLYRNGLTVWAFVLASLMLSTNTCRGHVIPIDVLKVPVRCGVLLLASMFSRKYVHLLVFKYSLMSNQFCPLLLNNNRGTINCNFVMITLQLSPACQIKLPSLSIIKLISSFEFGNRSSTSLSKNGCLFNL